MRTINILSFIIYPIVICFLLFIPLLGYFSFDLLSNLETRIPSYILLGTKYETSEFAFPLYLSTFFYFVSYVLIIISFYFFNKLIEQFKKEHIFHNNIIRYFRIMGYLLTSSFLIKFITGIFIKYNDDLFVKNNPIGVNNLFEMPIVILVFGLFFIILSKAFEIGKNQKKENIELKQENELTI